MTAAPLPINEIRAEIVQAFRREKRVIIKAPTGSGKSTQVPQMLLEEGLCDGRILILQPRRLAARMLAARVAEERSSPLGQEIGYQTRFEKQVGERTRACFITEGILPRLLLNDPCLDGISTIVFDEFHERSLTTDVSLALVADLQRSRRPDLRMIVMSATIDVEPLQKYLGDAAMISSAGRSYPIDIQYSQALATTPIWERATDACRSLISGGAEGDVLIFMPGVYEIRRTIEAIGKAVRGEQISVLPLYGDLPAQRQSQVMETIHCRKIIVATNIAETSLTIPGVRHVIDGGLARVNRYDAARGFNTLFTEPISRDSADQRAGRAGREAPGTCTRLWSLSRHAGLALRMTPEIARVDLAETVLSLRRLGYDSAHPFRWFEAPAPAALQSANELLELLGAFDSSGNLTQAGKDMSGFPMHPRLARLLLESGKRACLRLATFAAALLSERSALAGTPDFPEDVYRHEIASDFYAQYCLMDKISAGGFDPALCSRFAVNAGAAKNILRTQALFLQHCRRAGMHTHDDANAPFELARCLLLAYPDHFALRRDKGTLICVLRGNRRGVLARESVARTAQVLVAADIRETKSRGKEIKTILSLVTEIKEEWLHEHFEQEFHTESTCEWNPVTASVENWTRTSCLGVVLSESAKTSAITDHASALLAETIISKKLKLPLWDQSVEDWIKKVQWIAGLFPERKLPEFNEKDRQRAIYYLCEGEYRFDKVCAKPVLPVVRRLLDAQQHRFLEAMAPQTIGLPSGRKLRIFYDPKTGPRARTRIQDLYDMQATPRIADGRAAVLIEVLAPNNRPVQITHDMANFWAVHYPKLKTSLARRYPRHEWR